jgi:hypothetical protein
MSKKPQNKFSFSSEFVLNKAHFVECFEQSAKPVPLFKRYLKALILMALGVLLLIFIDANNYMEFFVFALGVLDALSVYYRKTWWVWRQLISRSSNATVTLSIDASGISTASVHLKQTTPWQNIHGFDHTELGFLVRHTGGTHYLSRNNLSDDAIEFIQKNIVSA